MKIRSFKPDDSASLASIYHEAVQVVGSNYYTPDQVEVWSPQPVPPERFLARVSDGRSVFVAIEDNDNPIGFIELEFDGHIDCFYCHPDFVGTGVGAVLYDRLESSARSAGMSRLYVEASEVARGFFLRMGFSLIGRRDFELSSVLIHNYSMEKFLL